MASLAPSHSHPYDQPPHVPEPQAEQVPRTNTTLNLSVLRRHNPSITDILSMAPYAVVYLFSLSTQTWEKTGVEGTLFVCSLSSPRQNHSLPSISTTPASLSSAERYEVFVLNRRGLENFEMVLERESDIDFTGEYVILSDGGMTRQQREDVGDGHGTAGKVFGIWIFEEGGGSTVGVRGMNAGVMRDCARMAEEATMAATGVEELMGQQDKRDLQGSKEGNGKGNSRTVQKSRERVCARVAE